MRGSHACGLSAQEYWRLRLDPDWEAYCTKLDDSTFEVISLEESADANGDVVITRLSRVTALTNPIPPSLRRFLGCETFSFTMNERWWRDRWDVDHPITFTTTPAVMADRISVSGSGWAEATEESSSCILHYEVAVKVSVFGVGARLAKGIEEGSSKACTRAACPNHTCSQPHTSRPPPAPVPQTPMCQGGRPLL